MFVLTYLIAMKRIFEIGISNWIVFY